MNILNILSISLGAILVENFVFGELFGISPFIEDSDRIRPAVKTGVAVLIALVVSSVLAWFVDLMIISPLGLGYMRSTVFVLVVCGVVAVVENILKAKAPKLYKKLGISIPIVTANAAVLGAMLITAERGYGFFEALVFGVSAGLGFLMSISLFAAVRERIEYSDVPKSLEGIPITFITAGLIALAFMGFRGMKFM